MSSVGFLQQFQHGDRDWQVVVEDDDRVGYAYLLQGERVVADVWLYNRVTAPLRPPWQEPQGEMPFVNPVQYVDGNHAIRNPASDDVRVSWSGSDQRDMEAAIIVGGQPIARLTPGSRPGWSALVTCDGPLAKTQRR